MNRNANASATTDPRYIALAAHLKQCESTVRTHDRDGDLQQEVYLKCSRNVDKILACDSPQHYLRRAIHRTRIDLRRRAVVREPFSAQLDTDRESDAPEPINVMIGEEGYRLIRQEVAKLREPSRNVIVRIFFHNDSIATIAKAQNLPFETIKTQLRRGKKRLRENPALRSYFPELTSRRNLPQQ